MTERQASAKVPAQTGPTLEKVWGPVVDFAGRNVTGSIELHFKDGILRTITKRESVQIAE